MERLEKREGKIAAMWFYELQKCWKDIECGPAGGNEATFVAALVFAEHAIRKQLDYFRSWSPTAATLIEECRCNLRE